MSATLPTSREFITQLLNSLPAFPPPSADSSAANATVSLSINPLNSAPEPIKKQLLTLHVLFPNEFLPALDLLDRRLVTRFRIHRCRSRNNNNNPENIAKKEEAAVQSSFEQHGQHANETEAAAQAVQNKQARETLSAPRCPAITTNTRAVGDISSPDAAATDTEPRMPDEGSVNMQCSDADETMPLVSCEPNPVVAAATTTTQEECREEQVSSTTAMQLEQQQRQHSPNLTTDNSHNSDSLYYVRSAQLRSSRYGSSYEATHTYEVRLKAWNCSCPAFAFSAFPSVHPEPPVPTISPTTVESEQDLHKMEQTIGGTGQNAKDWSFGGYSLGDGTPPVCKHLLACVLVERCAGLFGGIVEERYVGVEEAAGWAAGWGD